MFSNQKVEKITIFFAYAERVFSMEIPFAFANDSIHRKTSILPPSDLTHWLAAQMPSWTWNISNVSGKMRKLCSPLSPLHTIEKQEKNPRFNTKNTTDGQSSSIAFRSVRALSSVLWFFSNQNTFAWNVWIGFQFNIETRIMNGFGFQEPYFGFLLSSISSK